MITLHRVAELDAALGPLRGRQRIAFVPTMGNLHEGHLTLVRSAREQAKRVIVSIFVNPLQFGAGEDFDKYPRTLQRDAELLAAEGVDWLFAPPVAVMYPRPQAEQTQVLVPGLSDILCGASRPGHFAGVATVVCKLFNLVRPDVALFGQKDYQQLLVIRRMVEDLGMPVQVEGVATVREADGLAMSSRNGYLTSEERAVAPVLYRTLCDTAEGLRSGALPAQLERSAAAALDAAGLRSDYFSIRRQADLAEPLAGDSALVILTAAWLGQTRLIDNLEVSLDGESPGD
jgi:pantoate--beta-alanine ligase